MKAIKTIHQHKASYMLILLSMLTLCAKSQNGKDEHSGPSFNIQFEYQQKVRPDSLTIVYYPKGHLWDAPSYFTITPKADRRFSFRLPNMALPLKFKILTKTKGQRGDLGEYFAESADDVQLVVQEVNNSDSLRFLGRGAAKYNLTLQLNREFQHFKLNSKALQRPNDPDANQLIAYLNKLGPMITKQEVRKQQLISSEKALTPVIKDALDMEYANYNNLWTSVVSKYEDKPQQRNWLRNYFNANYTKFLGLKKEALIFCPRYVVGLTELLKLKLTLNSLNGKASLSDYYNLLKNQGDGKIKERLLVEFLINRWTMQGIGDFKPDVYDSLVVDASKSLISQQAKAIIATKIKLKKGSKLYASSFRDLKGGQLNISSLQGKVILLDIWGEGCGGCAQFHEKFENKIYPQLKTNKNFVVFSISLDKTKERWMKALSSNKYSSKSYLNVNTGEAGQHHDFLQYYNINAIPFILLVDSDFRLVSRISGAEPADEIVAMINSALKNIEPKILN